MLCVCVFLRSSIFIINRCAVCAKSLLGTYYYCLTRITATNEFKGLAWELKPSPLNPSVFFYWMQWWRIFQRLLKRSASVLSVLFEKQGKGWRKISRCFKRWFLSVGRTNCGHITQLICVLASRPREHQMDDISGFPWTSSQTCLQASLAQIFWVAIHLLFLLLSVMSSTSQQTFDFLRSWVLLFHVRRLQTKNMSWFVALNVLLTSPQ